MLLYLIKKTWKLYCCYYFLDGKKHWKADPSVTNRLLDAGFPTHTFEQILIVQSQQMVSFFLKFKNCVQ